MCLLSGFPLTLEQPQFQVSGLIACTATREACLAEINQIVLARAALDSVLLAFLMTSVFWLKRRAMENPPCVPAGGTAWAALQQVVERG